MSDRNDASEELLRAIRNHLQGTLRPGRKVSLNQVVMHLSWESVAIDQAMRPLVRERLKVAPIERTNSGLGTEILFEDVWNSVASVGWDNATNQQRGLLTMSVSRALNGYMIDRARKFLGIGGFQGDDFVTVPELSEALVDQIMTALENGTFRASVHCQSDLFDMLSDDLPYAHDAEERRTIPAFQDWKLTFYSFQNPKQEIDVTPVSPLTPR